MNKNKNNIYFTSNKSYFGIFRICYLVLPNSTKIRVHPSKSRTEILHCVWLNHLNLGLFTVMQLYALMETYFWLSVSRSVTLYSYSLDRTFTILTLSRIGHRENSVASVSQLFYIETL